MENTFGLQAGRKAQRSLSVALDYSSSYGAIHTPSMKSPHLPTELRPLVDEEAYGAAP